MLTSFGGDSNVVTNYNLSNFKLCVIHDMQVLELVSIDAKQSKYFLSESRGNLTQKDEIVDLDENTSQVFKFVIPRKMKNKKKQPGMSKGFNVGVSGRSPHFVSFYILSILFLFLCFYSSRRF